MTVTTKMIAEVVQEMFALTPISQDEFVGFGLISEPFKAEIILELFEVKSKQTNSETRQGMKMYLWFCVDDEKRLDLGHLSISTALELCWWLQDGLDWGTLMPMDDELGSIEIALYRAFDINTHDIQLAHFGDSDSELLRNIEYLSAEWELIAFILHQVASGELALNTHLQQLLYEPSSKVQ